jgi:hypothetical protein
MKENDTIRSYNAGYHRGLNTEYHDIKRNFFVYPKFFEWIKNEFDNRRFVFEPVYSEFERGYIEGVKDYEKMIAGINKE